jgi:hypothetical protein
MHHLLRRSICVAAAAAMLSGTAIAVAAQDDEDAGPVVPQPTECLAEPRDQAEIETILGSGEATFPLPEGLPVPLGTPADDQTRDEVRAVVYEVLACLNAGDAQRGATYFSENGLRVFYGPSVGTDAAAEQATAGTPTPRSEEQWLSLRTVTDTSVLDDGRIAAFAVIDDPLVRGERAQTLLIIFTEADGRLVIDGVVGFSLIVPTGTPTP